MNPPKRIRKALLERLYLGIVSLIQYIEAAPTGNTLLWFADKRTPVKTLPDFDYARRAAAELGNLIRCDFRETGQPKLAHTIDGHRLLYALSRNEDESVTLIVFGGGKSAAIDLDKNLLGQLIQLLKEYSR